MASYGSLGLLSVLQVYLGFLIVPYYFCRGFFNFDYGSLVFLRIPQSSLGVFKVTQGRRQGGSMGAVAPIEFEKGQIAPIDFHRKQGLKGSLHPSIEIPKDQLGNLHPLIEIPNDAPAT